MSSRVGSDCLPCKTVREKVMSLSCQDCCVFVNKYIYKIHKSGTVNENEKPTKCSSVFLVRS